MSRVSFHFSPLGKSESPENARRSSVIVLVEPVSP